MARKRSVEPKDVAQASKTVEQERLIKAQARYSAVFREAREREQAAEHVDPAAETLEDEEWDEEAIDSLAADAASIPDLGESISRIRARLRAHIPTKRTDYPSV